MDAIECITANQKFITKNLQFICDNTQNIEDLTISLISSNIISRNDRELIMAEKTSSGKNFKLYETLMKNLSDYNFSILLEILRNTNNEIIADIFEQKCSSSVENCKITDYVNSPFEFKRHKNISNKWWPEEKRVINSFVERHIADGKLLINQLKANLESGIEKKIVITQKTVVCGFGGIGKTTTAKWFAEKYSMNYNHIIWIDCEGPVLLTSIRRLAKQLHIEQTLGSVGSNLPPKSAGDLFREIETELASFKILFIYDNAESYSGINGIKEILTKLDTHHCLITSRNQSWGSADGYGAIPVYQLDVFTSEESSKFLTQTLRSKIKNKNVKRNELLTKLSNDLGRLPLALQHAVAAIKRIPAMTIEKYIAKIALQKEMYSFIQLDQLDDYEKSIYATFSITIEQLRTMQPFGQEAIDILYVCAFFRSDYIPTSIFEAEEALCLLDQYSMIGNYKNVEENSVDSTSDDEEEEDDEIYVTIHRLLQQVIFLHVKNEDSILPTLDKAIGVLSKCKNAEYHGEAVWDYIEKHLELVQRYSDFPNIAFKLQGYLTPETENKFVNSILSLDSIPNTDDVIELLAKYVENYHNDDDKVNLLEKILATLISLLENNVTMDKISKEKFLLAALYNQAKLFIRTSKMQEAFDTYKILCVHAKTNYSGKVWTTMQHDELSYILTIADDESVRLITTEWLRLTSIYENPPDIIRLGCRIYYFLKQSEKDENISYLPKDYISLLEDMHEILQNRYSCLKRVLIGLALYYKEKFEDSYNSLLEGVQCLKISNREDIRKGYYGYFNTFLLILKHHSEIIDGANKWDNFTETLLELGNLVTDYTSVGKVDPKPFLYKRAGTRLYGIFAKYSKYQLAAHVLEQLCFLIGKCQCMTDAELGSSVHFIQMLIIAELSAECYIKCQNCDKAISVWQNLCLRLQSIPSTFRAYREIREQNSLLISTLGNALKETIELHCTPNAAQQIETISNDVKSYFGFPTTDNYDEVR